MRKKFSRMIICQNNNLQERGVPILGRLFTFIGMSGNLLGKITELNEFLYNLTKRF